MKYSRNVEDAIRLAFEYDPVEGVLKWSTRGQSRRIGGIAGYARKDGYIDIDVTLADQRLRLKAHNVAWFLHYGYWPIGVLDHINHCRSDNRIDNLRDAGAQQNSENRVTAGKQNRAGLLGAIELPDARGYRAVISTGGHEVHLGVFDTDKEAHAAYLGAKKILHKGYVPE